MTTTSPEGVAPARRLLVRSASRIPAVLATLTWLYGAASIIGAVRPFRIDNRRVTLSSNVLGLPLQAAAAAAAVSVALGVMLLFLAGGLRRRKRRVWRGVTVILVLVAVSHVLRGPDLAEAVIALVLLGILIATRREFYALGDPSTRWYALRVLLELVVLGIAIGMAGMTLNYRRLAGRPSMWTEFQEVVLGFFGISGPVSFRSDRANDFLTAILLGYGLVTLFIVTYLLLRSAEPRAVLTVGDETRLRELLAREGARDSLGYFALRRDKSVVWSPSGKAAVLYRVVSGVALASGDPIGDPEAWPGAIEEFLERSRQHAWIPAVMGDSELGATIYSRFGLDALELGDEAIVEPSTFSLEGRPMRGVRQAVKRVERAGYDVAIRRVSEIDAAELVELARAAEAWRGDEAERGFSMALSRFGDPDDAECVVVTAHQDGVVRGLLNFVPWGYDGLSLDLMRRDRNADNGLNELLIVRVIEGAKQLGVTRISLNFAVFRSALERGERIGAGPILRIWRGVLVFLSRWWQIETLYRFNVKFRPSWEPRFLSFPATRDLPRIAVAALQAEAFIVRSHRLQQILRRPA